MKTPQLGKKKSIGGDSASVNLSTTDSRSSTPVLELNKKVKVDSKVSEEEAAKRKKRSENVEKVRRLRINLRHLSNLKVD